MSIKQKILQWVVSIKRILLLIGIVPSLTLLAIAGGTVDAGVQASLLRESIDASQKVTSAQFVDTLSQRLGDDKYAAIMTAIEGDNTAHSSSFPVWSQDGGKFGYNDVAKYISIIDEVGNLYVEGIIDKQMAYTEFYYDAEKAWCNKSINDLVISDRKSDGTYKYNDERKDWYGFEQISTAFLKIDNEKCSNLESQ